jgi:tetratricopeptide (TPR) repeat protein
MAAQEETTQQRAVFVDTSNEPRTDEEAVSMCTQGLERATAPQDIADLQFRLANAQVRRGFPELAVAAFRACIEADPRRIDAFNNLGLLLLRRYDYEAAATEFRNGLAISESADLLLNLGVAVEHAGDLNEAQRCYQRAIEVAPTDARPHANLGALAAKRGALDASIACHRQAVDLDPDDPWLSFNLGDALEDAGDDENAMEAYEAAISLPNAKNNLAGLLEKSGDHDRADALYAECCRQSPDDYDFAVNRACCARARGAEDAEALFDAAATLSERPYACSYNIAELAAARGDIQTALARAKEAVAHASEEEIDDARELLRALLEAWRDSLDDASVVEDALAHGLEIR